MTKLLYQGHASFRLTSNEGKVCYIDPFAGEGYDKEADLVLITHEHYDHNAIDKVKMKDNCVAIRSKDALNQGIYRTFAEKSFKIKAVPAYNSHHPKGFGVGYVIEVDGIKIYRTNQQRTVSCRKFGYYTQFVASFDIVNYLKHRDISIKRIHNQRS